MNTRRGFEKIKATSKISYFFSIPFSFTSLFLFTLTPGVRKGERKVKKKKKSSGEWIWYKNGYFLPTYFLMFTLFIPFPIQHTSTCTDSLFLFLFNLQTLYSFFCSTYRLFIPFPIQPTSTCADGKETYYRKHHKRSRSITRKIKGFLSPFLSVSSLYKVTDEDADLVKD